MQHESKKLRWVSYEAAHKQRMSNKSYSFHEIQQPPLKLKSWKKESSLLKAF